MQKLQQTIANQRRQLKMLQSSASAPRKARRASKAVRKSRKAPAKRSGGLLSSAFSSVGRALGGVVGLGGLGSSIGSGVGSLISSITGFGDYKVMSNTLVADTGPPEFKSSGHGEIIVSHREFIQDISGSTGFSSTTFDINPGLSTSFPWLSQVAGAYQQYQFLGLVFEFKSTSAVAVNSTNTALGTVVMTTQYDALKQNFTNKQDMEAYEYTVSGPPSQSLIHPVECDPSKTTLKEMYVRTSSTLPANSDQRFYDLGNFQFATVGMQAAATIGELWVSYQIRLLKPQLPSVIGGQINAGHATIVPTSTNTFAGLVNKSYYPLVLSNTGNNTLTWPAVSGATYIVLQQLYGSSATVTYGAWGLSSQGYNIFNNNTSSSAFYNVTAGANALAIACVAPTATGNFSVTLTASTVTSVLQADVFVIQVPSSLGLSGKLEQVQQWLTSQRGLELLQSFVSEIPKSARPQDYEDDFDSPRSPTVSEASFQRVRPTTIVSSLSRDDDKRPSTVQRR